MAGRPLIPAPLTGKDFHDSHLPFIGFGPTLTTTFQDAFPSYPTLPKRRGKLLAPQGQVEHKDLARIREFTTETVIAFPHHHQKTLSAPTPTWNNNKWLKTNWKMQSDNQPLSYLTTHADNLKPQVSTYKRSTPPVVDTARVLTQLKEKLPETTHKATFPPHNVSAIVKAPVKHLGGEPTIKGDLGRCYFNTHHNEEFIERQCNPPPRLKPLSTSVAMGDPKNILLRETTNQESFKHPGVPSPVTIPKRLQINLGDDSDNTWKSTMSASFQNHKPDPVCLMKADNSHNGFPKGEIDVGRNREWMTATTNNLFFTEVTDIVTDYPTKKLPSLNQFPAITENHNLREQTPHVIGANLRNNSSVEFGRPSLGGQFYSTTTQDHYPRRGIDRVKPTTYPSGQVLGGHESGAFLTTAHSDFLPHNCRRQELDPGRLQEIKGSHISAPDKKQHFGTTHNEAFGLKPLSRRLVNNPPRRSG